MPVGMITLIVLAVLIYFGVVQRVLDRMHLTDRSALLFIAAMFFGSYLPDIPLTSTLAINIGGGIVPLVLSVYLIVKADTAREKSRAILASLIATAAIYGAMKILPAEPTHTMFLDPMILFALLAGIIAYLAGRSRRSAFIAATMGLVLTDIITHIQAGLVGARTRTVIGGAGIFDAVILSGIIAVGLAEIVGESREWLAGGSEKEKEERQKAKDGQAGVPGPVVLETAKELVPPWEKTNPKLEDKRQGNKREVSEDEGHK
ncbi:MAG: DUF1614 domain-containing protein [Firmicutes bacterium]|nr:DUF1614 domain-containing protein [Bacillota bacterium]